MAVTWKKLAYEADVVLQSLYDANTILAATSDNTPVALTVAEQSIVGRITGGNIAALTGAQVRTLLGTAPFVLGSDATGDIFYRAASTLARLGIIANAKLFGKSDSSAPEWATGFHLGNYSRGTPWADLDCTGPGFKPSMIIVIAVDGTEVNASIGIAWSSNKYVAFQMDSSSGAGKWYYSAGTGSTVLAMNTSATKYLVGSVKTWNDDGITMTFVNAGSYTGTPTFSIASFR